MDDNCQKEDRLHYSHTFVTIDYFSSCSNFDNFMKIANRNLHFPFVPNKCL